MFPSSSKSEKVNNKRKNINNYENDTDNNINTNTEKKRKITNHELFSGYTMNDFNLAIYTETIDRCNEIIKIKKHRVFDIIITNKCEEKNLKTKECKNQFGQGITKNKCTNSITNIGCDFCEKCLINELKSNECKNNKNFNYSNCFVSNSIISREKGTIIFDKYYNEMLKKNKNYLQEEYNFNYDKYIEKKKINIDISELLNVRYRKEYICDKLNLKLRKH